MKQGYKVRGLAPEDKPLTPKQRKFADIYAVTGNGTEAALAAYNTTRRTTAAMIATENKTQPNVRAYLASKAQEMSEIVTNLARASEQDAVRLNAAKDILDRAGYKPVDKSQSLAVSVALPAGTTPQNSEALLALRQEYEEKLRLALGADPTPQNNGDTTNTF